MVMTTRPDAMTTKIVMIDTGIATIDMSVTKTHFRAVNQRQVQNAVKARMVAEMRTRFHAVKVHWIKTSVMQKGTTSKGELVLMTMKEIMMTSIRLREARVP